MIPEEPREFLGYTRKLMAMVNIYYAKVLSNTIPMTCPSTSFQRFFLSVTQNPIAKRCLIGSDFKPQHHYLQSKCNADKALEYPMIKQGILQHPYSIKGACTLQLPDYSRLVTDCSKMAVLHDLMRRLNKGGHRCLIFCQMTRMMDILEDFLIW